MTEHKANQAASMPWTSKLYSNGWTSGEAGTRDITEPATGKVLASAGVAGPGDVARAAESARKAQAGWIAMPYEERAGILRKAAQLVEERSDMIAQWIIRETGSVMPKARFELSIAIGALRESAAMLTQPQGLVLPSDGARMSFARRIPHGVVAVISPFNSPVALSMRAIAPALACGNAVITKPDLQTPVTGGFLMAQIFEEAGLPSGLFHVLPGGAEVGEALCTDRNISMVSFTGSTATGRRVGELCGRTLKKVSLELGGKSSLIILDDADIDIAASNAAWGAWLHQGQICMTAGRLLVQKKLVPHLVERLVEKANKLPVGDPATGHVALGPMINRKQVDRVHRIVQATVAAGAKLKAGGTHDELFYKPTVLEGVKRGMPAWDEEMFGPVAAITAFETDDEAVAMATDTNYGLSLGVISNSVSRAMAMARRIPTGLLHINDQTVHDEAHIPFGGVGDSGNGGRHGGPSNWDEFSQWQWVTIKDQATAYPF
jgi:benzaldehyde dehydrogenase (NAD)